MVADDIARPLCGTPELPPGQVALTFDDGPGPRSAELARLLQDEGVPGTFFVLGESAARYGEALDEFRDRGHVIGLHGDRHRPFRSAADAAAQLSRAAARISGYLTGPVWFRPPYGVGDWPVPGFAGPVGWHAHGRDWDITYRHGQTVRACVDAIADGLIRRGGGIALLHDFAGATEFVAAGLTEADLDLRILEITRSLIDRLREAGLSFTALPEPAPADSPAPAPAAVPAPAPTPTPAPPARLAAPAAGPAPDVLGTSEDLKTLRLFRATARAAGGVLDLVMPVRTDGDGPILFCAHPVVGLSWCYLALLPHLDARFPVYGLQARGLRRPEPLPASMAEMARDYADQIRAVQPSGPYHLLGWSLGGNIAFAVAEELRRRGEPVGLLAIMDSTLVGLDAIEGGEPWMVYNLVLAQFGYVPALSPAEPDPAVKMLELVRRRPGLGLDDWPEQRLRALPRVIKNNVAVARGHRPGRISCPLLFFSATRNPPDLETKLESWRSFVDGPIEAVELDCDHRQMLLPEPVAALGAALSDRLARAGTPIPAPIV